MKPSNAKEINDKFWIMLALYAVSILLVGFAVYTNVNVPNQLSVADEQSARQKYDQNITEQDKLFQKLKELNLNLEKMQNLNDEVLEGSLLAKGSLTNEINTFNIKLNSLRVLEDSDLKNEILATLEKFSKLISIGSEFRKETMETREDLIEQKRDHQREIDRINQQLQTCMGNYQ